MKSIKTLLLITLCSCLLPSCIVPFEPKDLVSVDPILVVEGSISLEAPFEIVLSRTVPLTHGIIPMSEANAVVEVVDQNGTIYPSYAEPETGRHAFDLTQMHLNTQLQYFLRIRTENGEVYESEPQLPIYTPPFEVSYIQDDDKQEMRVMVSSYDPSAASKYYMWTYKETWDYLSLLTAYCMFDTNIGLVDLNGQTYMHRCWGTRHSSNLLLANTEKLSEDRIRDYVIKAIPYRDNSITQYYMISISQAVLTETAYQYMENMRKNSDDIGGLFSPQPNEVRGNIKCVTNPDLMAVGYILVGTGRSETVLIDCTRLPTERETLPMDTITAMGAPFYGLRQLYNAGYRPYQIEYSNNTVIWNETRCVDCRVRGGSPTPPDYWPSSLPRH